MTRHPRKQPAIYGTGFIPLDVVVDKNSGTENVYAGGTCGNVLSILAFFGWRASPIGRLKEDVAGALVRDDLEGWGVNLAYIGLEPQSPTPIVIEEIYRGQNGQPKHRYVWTCPDCGGYLPSYRAVLSKTAEQFAETPSPDVFFFDRVSRSSIDLAHSFSERGAVVVFEPSGSTDPRLFKQAIRVCHVLKYSSQRVRAFADLLKTSKALIEIETLGEEGLRYRTMLSSASKHEWKTLPSFHVDDVKDTAGCGDWCTAGIISRLAANGQRAFKTTPLLDLERALQFGQALSAWNCRFTSARGGMYQMGASSVLKAADKILHGSSALKPRLASAGTSPSQGALFCPSCAGPESRTVHPRMRKVSRAV